MTDTQANATLLTLEDGTTVEPVGEYPWNLGGTRTTILLRFLHPDAPGLGMLFPDEILGAGLPTTLHLHLGGDPARQREGAPVRPFTLRQFGLMAVFLARLHATAGRPGAVARMAQNRLGAFFVQPEGIRLGLWRELAQAALAKYIDDDPHAGQPEALGMLATELQQRLAPFEALAVPEPAVVTAIPDPTPERAALGKELDGLFLDDATPPVAADGTMLSWDALRLQVLEDVPGFDVAKYRDGFRKRWDISQADPCELWRPWLEGDAAPSALVFVARQVWDLLVRPELAARDSDATAFTPKQQRGYDKRFTLLPRLGSELGQLYADAATEQLDVDLVEVSSGRRFARPLTTRGWDLLPTTNAKGTQLPLLLAYTMPPDEQTGAMVEIVKQTAMGERNLSVVAAKVAALLLSDRWPTRRHRLTLHQIATYVFPNTRIQAPQLRLVAIALEQLKALHAYSRSDQTRIQAFAIPRLPAMPEQATRDAEVVLYVEPEFVAMERQLGLPGAVIIDWEGTMAIPTKDAVQFRSVMFAANQWNRVFSADCSDFSAERMPWMSVREWAQRTNSLTPAAAAYLKSKDPAGHRRYQSGLRDSQDRVLAALEAARDSKLLRLNTQSTRRGDGCRVQVLPPPDMLEARQRYALTRARDAQRALERRAQTAPKKGRGRK